MLALADFYEGTGASKISDYAFRSTERKMLKTNLKKMSLK